MFQPHLADAAAGKASKAERVTRASDRERMDWLPSWGRGGGLLPPTIARAPAPRYGGTPYSRPTASPSCPREVMPSLR